MNTFESVVRIIVTALLSGAIGYERELQSRPAGLRTHIMVGVGSALFMIIAIEMYELYPSSDVTRIPAQVVSGIGFLGAGTIFAHRGSVTGLTTAASLWLVSGLGLIIGLGKFAIGVFTTAIGLLILVSLKRLYEPIHLRQNHVLIIIMDPANHSVSELMDLIRKQELEIEEFQIERPKSLADKARDTEILIKVNSHGKFDEKRLKTVLSSHGFDLKMSLRENQ